VNGYLIKAVKRGKGRFRSFLLTALRNYTFDVQRKDKHIASVGLDSTSTEPSCHQDAERDFNRTWAEELLDRVLADLKRECNRIGKIAHWELFCEWLVEPRLEQDEASMDDLCAKYGLTNAEQGYKIIFRMKERFRKLLRERLRSLVSRNEDIDLETEDFIAAFSN
jgi:hypothetical protein